jgi:hypothetical protein
MSLEETGLSVWELETTPLAILVAAKATDMVGARLSAGARAPFLALSEAIIDWWPRRTIEPELIYEREFRACLEAYAATEPPAPLQPVLTGAYVQMAALLKVAPRSLPAEGYYDLDEKDFSKLLRDAAKVGRLPVGQLEARLRHLLERAKDPWRELVARAGRMSWTAGAPWSKLDKRLRALASLADLGATSTWTIVSDQRALEIQLDGTRRIAILSAAEIEALRAVIPAIPAPE